jgi:membrane protease YdiL (CAAX protease family)
VRADGGAVSRRVRTPLLVLPVVAGGTALLLARPWLVSIGLGPAGLAFLYVALGAVAAATPVGTVPSSPDRRKEQFLHPALGLAVGMGGFVLARAVAAPGIPVAVGVSGLFLNLVAAVAEEAFFRKFLYGTLLSLGAAGAVAVTSVAFALVHVPLYGGAVFWVDFGAGLLLGWQRWATGTWEVPGATHAAANILAVLR